MKTNQKHIPIFPLGVVLLPEMIMPLHIFEERYKTMTNDCLKQDEPFGIVYFDGKKVHRVGCEARIVKILKHYEDGCMDILVKGEKRFYMDQIDERHDYLMSDIIYIGDAEESLKQEGDALIRKANDLFRYLNELSGSIENNVRLDQWDLKQLSFIVPGTEGFTMEERQRFLEMTSVHERLEKGMKVLEKVIARAKINREVTEVIGGNGHVRAFLSKKGPVP